MNGDMTDLVSTCPHDAMHQRPRYATQEVGMKSACHAAYIAHSIKPRYWWPVVLSLNAPQGGRGHRTQKGVSQVDSCRIGVAVVRILAAAQTPVSPNPLANLSPEKRWNITLSPIPCVTIIGSSLSKGKFSREFIWVFKWQIVTGGFWLDALPML